MKLLFMFILIMLFSTSLLTQDNRVGTTAATFLEMGIGSAGNAMGEAYVSVARDLSSIYWNPSGLAYIESNEAQFMYRPWIADINITFVGGAVFLPRIGTLALGITSMNFGSTEVTTLEMQEGTGEMFSAMDYAVSFSYARKLAQWFAFGVTGKFISSEISRLNANAIAMDLGVIVNTRFFSPDGNRENGLTIGMSISNYGTRMRYEGMELLRSIDILPNQHGNYKDVEGQFKLQSWDLPVIFRIGVSFHPIIIGSQRLTLSLDALHPNNNSESVNAGAEYQIATPSVGCFLLRGGWHGLFLDGTQHGLTFGSGIHFTLLHNKIVKVDYAFQDVGILGNYSTFTLGIVF
ncbi:MAG: PorV/PorQ family protein [Candidatus Marinimicrobia bacterium]|nr:PorV/PorQ family protein [Candidatus Neomarinimicrobiota bacterium]